MQKTKNLTMENVRIGFRNFSGKEGNYNRAGTRTFCVMLEEDDAIRLKEDGWNVKWLKPKTEDDDPRPILSVEAKYGDYPPKIVMITSCGQNELNEDSIAVLDWAEIETVDLMINPYDYNVNGRTGIKAYLRSMYITIVEDELEKKYQNVPDSADNAMRPDCDSLTSSCADCGKCRED